MPLIRPPWLCGEQAACPSPGHAWGCAGRSRAREATPGCCREFDRDPKKSTQADVAGMSRFAGGLAANGEQGPGNCTVTRLLRDANRAIRCRQLRRRWWVLGRCHAIGVRDFAGKSTDFVPRRWPDPRSLSRRPYHRGWRGHRERTSHGRRESMFVAQGSGFQPTEFAVGPWSPDLLQGSAYGGLLIRSLERTRRLRA